MGRLLISPPARGLRRHSDTGRTCGCDRRRALAAAPRAEKLSRTTKPRLATQMHRLLIGVTLRPSTLARLMA